MSGTKRVSFTLLVVLCFVAYATPAAGSSGMRACHWNRHAVHVRHASLPSWFTFRSWPELTPVDVTPVLDTPVFSAQDLEDKYAYENFFFKRVTGTYVEFGAGNGIDLSNTFWYAKTLGWRGLLIEGSPSEFNTLAANRPRDVCVNAAVCEKEQDVHYADCKPPCRWAMRGIWEFMGTKFKEEFHKGVKVEDLPVVQCAPLGAMLAKFNMRHINFMSVDVEGGELQALKSIDFRCVTIDVIVVEQDGRNPEKDDAVRALLRNNGYKLFEHVVRNDWFVHESFERSARP